MIRSLIPYPILSFCLFGMWLVLAGRYSPGQILLALVVGILGGLLMRTLDIDRPLIRRPRAALRLIGVVTYDVIRSNLAVVWIILRRNHSENSSFMQIPLDLTEPMGLTVLACIVTATPGTIWVDYDRRTGVLLLHILDLIDEEQWLGTIKGRYERLLLEILR